MNCLVIRIGPRYSCRLSGVTLRSSLMCCCRSALLGGTYAQNHTQWTDNELIEAMNVDVTSRMINNIWGQGQTYVQFTDLGDGGIPHQPFS